MSVKRTFSHRIPGHKNKIGVILLLCPLAQPVFVLGRQVRLTPAIFLVLLIDKLLRLRKMDVREHIGNGGHFDFEHIQFSRVILL